MVDYVCSSVATNTRELEALVRLAQRQISTDTRLEDTITGVRQAERASHAEACDGERLVESFAHRRSRIAVRMARPP